MLPLRLCLILAILAGIGVIVISQVVLRPHVQGIIDARNDFNKKWTKAEDDKKKLNKELNETKSTLQSTKNDLDASRTAYAELDKTHKALEKTSADQRDMIAKQKAQMKTMDDELARWRSSPWKPEELSELPGRFKKLEDTIAAMKEEASVLMKAYQRATNTIAALTGNRDEVDVPYTVRGKVLVVDPKWDFLVLDVGSKQGLLERGVLLISRNGTLVAKVRVVNVQNERCIANIMPGWKLKDVVEGDLVFPYAPKSL